MPLIIAEGRVRQAIRKSGSRNFWELQTFLPLETRNHVKKFIGTHYVFEGNGGLTTMTASEIEDYDIQNWLLMVSIKHADLIADDNYTKVIRVLAVSTILQLLQKI